jgi:N-methylhydantoinase A
MQLDTKAAAAALQPIADRFGLSIEAAADSAVRLANANIVRSIQLISTERGYDPRDYALVAFGGAGPLHAAPIAEELAIKTIVIPPSAGVISAYGLIASDFVMFESLTRRERAGPEAADLVRSVFAEMKERATARAKALGLAGELRLEFTADMRFVGQAFEVPVTFSDTEIDGLSAQTVRQRFLDAHDRIYFFGKDSDKPIEFVSFRLGIILPLGELPLLTESATGAVAEGRIRIFDNREWHDGVLKSRSAMRQGTSIPGPALLEDPTSTLLVPAGWTASRDQADNTILTRKG